MKVAIVHDWLVGGGAERVVMALHEMYPDAPIFTAYCNESSRRVFKDADIRTSYMQGFPFSKLRKFLPVMRQRWFEKLDLTEYDLVISSSGAEAKGIAKLKPGAKHVSYCHSPTHYYWVRYDEYMKHPGFGVFDPIARIGLRMLVGRSRKWDYEAAQRADVVVANSTCVKDRIAQFYKRESIVVHPPVDTKRFALSHAPRSGFVVAGRQTPYKRIDLAVEACTKFNLPLKVIGTGPDHERLRHMAGPSIEFLTNVSDVEMPGHFGSAIGFIFPNEDDFGIVPVEAMATGTPVIAYKKGGALDYVIDGKSGVFFDEQSADALGEALMKASDMNWDEARVSACAEKFSVDQFKSAISDVVRSAMSE